MREKLYRSNSDVIVGGVASGVAQYFGLDPTIVRLVWAAAFFFGGTGALLYIIAWILIPPAPDGEPSPSFERGEQIRQRVIDTAKDVEDRIKGSAESRAHSTDGSRNENSQSMLGWLLIAVGVLFLARNVFSWFSIGEFWPLILVVLGIVLIIQEMRR